MKRPWVKVLMLSSVILITGVGVLGINYLRQEQLIKILRNNSFCSKPHTVVEFKDSINYRILSDTDSLVVVGQGKGTVESDLLGVYLILRNDSPLKLTGLSETIITFSRGEFEPKFIKFYGHMNELTGA